MIDWDSQPLRSLLFVPGSDEHKLSKAGTFGADAVVIDLEDAVADDRKVAARATAREALHTYGDMPAVVRVNGINTGMLDADVAAVVTDRLDAIMIPKVEDPETLVHADAVVGGAEQAAGMVVGTIRLLAIVETPLGITCCEALMAQAPARVHTAVFGSGDFTAALDVDLTTDATEVLYARSRLVVATRAAGLAAPIDGGWLRLDDLEGLRADSARSRQLGFQGRVAVYPPQIAAVTCAYSSLSEESATRARRIVAAFEHAEADGIASLRVDGQFVDYPIYRRAREQLIRHDSQSRQETDR